MLQRIKKQITFYLHVHTGIENNNRIVVRHANVYR